MRLKTHLMAGPFAVPVCINYQVVVKEISLWISLPTAVVKIRFSVPTKLAAVACLLALYLRSVPGWVRGWGKE